MLSPVIFILKGVYIGTIPSIVFPCIALPVPRGLTAQVLGGAAPASACAEFNQWGIYWFLLNIQNFFFYSLKVFIFYLCENNK